MGREWLIYVCYRYQELYQISFIIRHLSLDSILGVCLHSDLQYVETNAQNSQPGTG